MAPRSDGRCVYLWWQRVASVDSMSLETSLGVLRDLRSMATACSWMW